MANIRVKMKNGEVKEFLHKPRAGGSYTKTLRYEGVFALPGLLKIMVIQKPATPARKGINPFTKQEQMFAAKPARRAVKVRPLKALKDMAK